MNVNTDAENDNGTTIATSTTTNLKTTSSGFFSHRRNASRGVLGVKYFAMCMFCLIRPMCHILTSFKCLPFVPDNAAMWLKVPTDFCHYISIASHYGFKFHHTQPKYVMMYLWLPEDVPDKVPPYGTHHLGVAGEGWLKNSLGAASDSDCVHAGATPGGCVVHIGSQLYRITGPFA